ncbi:hypothetical protein TWF694_008063 [Orbilia ellipsospora]|uniref:Beta-galactosidase n=1 Tax=Orbilia ellipsospora TaxID=2528407 RepID=A0AAV9XEZ0_9PEZI
MVLFGRVSLAVAAAAATIVAAFPAQESPPGLIIRQSSSQTNVTWDKYSLSVNGKRVMLYSGEVHPFRNPVQSLHLDVFQKIKAMGFNCVSFYVHWGFIEYDRGTFNWNGIHDLQPFFDAAKAANIWLLARPGPYINAEASGGGFPGWGTRVEGLWRNSNSNYTSAWQPYWNSVSQIIAKNQITNGGPVILVQPENEYTSFPSGSSEDKNYENNLLNILHSNGVVVPTISNDAWAAGNFKSVNIYGYDSYPAGQYANEYLEIKARTHTMADFVTKGFDCSHPTTWPSVPNFWGSHQGTAPNTPHAIVEYQGGSFDPWGGSGWAACNQLLGPQFARVFYKDIYASAVTIFNIYMTYGGTNWGHIGHPGVYTSYDYAAAIAEDRTLREKYYEEKLQALFLKVSPAYLTSTPGTPATVSTSSSQMTITTLKDNVGGKTRFNIIRQSNPNELTNSNWKLSLTTSAGTLSVPTLNNANFVLPSRDSKTIVTDYSAGGVNILYSTSEILTWQVIDSKTIIVLYANKGEIGETAIISSATLTPSVLSGNSGSVSSKQSGSTFTIQYQHTGATVISLGSNILLYVVERVDAYNFWVPDLSIPVILKGGYLLRAATFSGNTLSLSGDTNGTTTFEVFAGSAVSTVTWNGKGLSLSKTSYGSLTGTYSPTLPSVSIPTLSSLTWKYADSLPEIQTSYDDSKWVSASNTYTPNSQKPSTPVILYASDYGFHSGNILWRGHFTATGGETAFKVTVQGGSGFGYSVWDNGVFIGAWTGNGGTGSHSDTFTLSTWAKGSKHVITVVQDHSGLEQNWTANTDSFKAYRGISAYSFNGATPTLNGWKVTGNLGGEKNVDTVRGGYNEGGLYGERQGWHLPGFDDSSWAAKSPQQGPGGPAIEFYRTTFSLSIPSGVDYPMSIDLGNAINGSPLRAQIFVNGYHFGKYIDNIGPQVSFPIPQGILNYNGANTLAISLWNLQKNGAGLKSLSLRVRAMIEGGVGTVSNAPMPTWTARPNSYESTGSGSSSTIATTTKATTTTSVVVTTTVSSAQSTATIYGQCGGTGYTGPTKCASGSTCTYSNPLPS